MYSALDEWLMNLRNSLFGHGKISDEIQKEEWRICFCGFYFIVGLKLEWMNLIEQLMNGI